MRAVALVILALCLEGTAQTWTQLPDFPGTARDDAASFSIGSKIYAGTGYQVGWVLANDWYMFDATTNSWSAIEPLPSSPRQYCSTFVLDSIGYVFGGLDADGALNELWAYDPVLDQWTQKASLPGEARYACGSFACYAKGYISTGMLDSGLPTKETWRYDPLDDSWLQVADLPGVARHRTASIDYSSALDPNAYKGVVAGGADSDFTALSDCWVYNAFGGEWDTMPPLPEARYAADASYALVAFQTAFLLGGISSDGTVRGDGYAYQSSTEAWQHIDALLPFGRAGGTMTNGFSWETGVFIMYTTGIDSLQVRHNDAFGFISTLGIENIANPHLGIFPNPGNDHFAIQCSSAAPLEVRITDAQGRIVLAVNVPSGSRIDTNDWDQGIYIVTANEANGRTYRARWIKQ